MAGREADYVFIPLSRPKEKPMGMMTGSGECWSGDCDHNTSHDRVRKLEELLTQAVYNDPSKHVNGKPWHDEVKEALK